MTRLWAQVHTPAALLYAGPILAGALGTDTAAVWVFAAILLAHMALSGHRIFRGFTARSLASWAGLAALAAVQLALAAAIYFGAGAIARSFGAPMPGVRPVWPLIVSAAALPFSWRLRNLTDPEFTKLLDTAFAGIESMSAELQALGDDPEAWARRDAERTAQERADLDWKLNRADGSLHDMDAEDRGRLVGKLARMHIESEVLDALTARVADPEWRRLRQDYLGHPDVMGFDFDMTDFVSLFVDELSMPEFRDRAAETGLLWFADLGWTPDQTDPVLDAARRGPRSAEIERLIAELEAQDDR